MAMIVVFSEYGEPEVLRVVEVDDPVPACDEVLIRVKAAGVQPFDAAYRRGTFARFRPDDFPAQVGNEVAGVVDAVGSSVTDLVPGDEVIAFRCSAGLARRALRGGQVDRPGVEVVPARRRPPGAPRDRDRPRPREDRAGHGVSDPGRTALPTPACGPAGAPDHAI